MRIGIFGAGSIGCYLGGRLIAAGHDVVMVGRAAEVATQGLTLTDYAGRCWRIEPAALRYGADASLLADREAVLVTVKSPDTAAAAAALAPVLAPGAVVASFQNGVRNAEVLRGALPGCVVLAGMVPFNVVRGEGGRFHNGTSGPLELERQGGAEAALAAALSGAGFDLALHADMRRVQWSKLLINVNNAVNALSGLPLREQLADRAYRRLMADVLREALACVRADGIRPVRIGRLIIGVVPTALSLPNWLFFRVAAAMVKIDPAARSSMWEDLERRRRTEVDELNGEIVRIGERVGVATPLSRRLCELVREAERAGAGSPNLGAAALRARLSA